jgi:quercetin dioxygenase-like cupin family protein
MSLKLEEKTAAEAAERPIASYETLLDDDKTCITLFTIKPGEQTGWHRHEFDYVAVQQSTGRLHLDYADGSVREIDYTPGVATGKRERNRHVPATQRKKCSRSAGRNAQPL